MITKNSVINHKSRLVKSNPVTAENFAAILAQENLASKNDIANFELKQYQQKE